MPVEEEEAPGIPEWVVTFGDMMSLLLTFFIMLVSLSEVKNEEEFQALAEAMRKQFGYENSRRASLPGDSPPRNSAFAAIATQGRAKKLDIMRGGDKTKAPSGDYRQVRIIREGTNSGVGTVIGFADTSADLTDEMRSDLELLANEIRGKPQKIEVRGHTSRRPIQTKSSLEENFGLSFELAYLRCRNTMKFLSSLGIQPQRFRISVAGPNEPVAIGTGARQLEKNSRVEIYLLDEIVSDREGSDAQRIDRFIEPKN